MRSRPVSFRSLDLNLLKVFEAVMAERNVTRAAARLAMTQPAVSNALRRLRDATGDRLFAVHAGKMVPTAAADALSPVVRDALHSLRSAFEPQGFDARLDERSFTVSMADATAALFAPILADTLLRERARVTLQVASLTTRDPRPLLEQRLADAAIGFFPEVTAALSQQGEVGTVRREPLYRCEYVCVMRRGHRLARPGALTLDAYCAASHLRVNFAAQPRGFVDEALARLGRARRITMTVSQFATAGAVVHQTDLLTVLPRSFVPATGFEDLLATRALPFELPAIDVSLLWHGGDADDEAQRWLRRTLTRCAAELAVGRATAS